MPPRTKKTIDLTSTLDSFAARLERVEFAPNINRYQPMPKQDIFHQRQNRHRVLRGGNRGGKTYSSTADDVLVALRKHPHRQHLYEDRPLRLRFIGVDFERGIMGAALPLFQQFLPPSSLINGTWKDSFHGTRMLLTLADGTTVNFMSYEQDPDKFQAVWLDHIHMDEEPPKPIFSESRLRLADKNGTMTISMTPVQQMEWLEDDVINPTLDGHMKSWSVDDLDTRENVHLSAEAVAEIAEGLSAEEQLVRLTGGYSNTTKVFPEFKGSYPNVIRLEEFEDDIRRDTRWEIYESMDYGYSNPTAWLWTAVHPDGRIVTFKELYRARVVVPEWVTLVHAAREEITQMLGRPWRPRLTIGDPSIARAGESAAATGLSVQQLYALGGIFIGTEGIVKARAANQNIGLEKIHGYLRKRRYEDQEIPWWQIAIGGTEEAPTGPVFLVSELRRARLPHQSLKQKEQANAKEQIRDKDNHAIDAIKYLFIVTHDLRPQERIGDEIPTALAPDVMAAMGVTRIPELSYAGAAQRARPHDPYYYQAMSSDNYYELET